MRKLVLRVNKKYFDQIESGDKLDEYRERTDYWYPRIVGIDFDAVEIIHGYPKAGEGRRILFAWDGYVERGVGHEIFGWKTTPVFAISLRGGRIDA